MIIANRAREVLAKECVTSGFVARNTPRPRRIWHNASRVGVGLHDRVSHDEFRRGCYDSYR
ncbi:hypothetical protein PISMIDRAFT_681020 [Pisolithus microcarpus 441]|uniref:Uncharacterized protein n=1 Tax=Pisolithus microcarpus 441 TaxID=765257 RepID=A0A0C9ZPS4_9AGAM|nr:hypothetical protein PISMIDRAFT_681020 [Pisolithus microcarpus 441]